MAKEKAPAGQGEGKDQNPTIQEENRTMSILTDSEAVHQSLREWAADYAAELRAIIATAANSEAYAAFCRSFSVDRSEPAYPIMWAQEQAHGAEAALRALPIWPTWVEYIELGMIIGGETMITTSGAEHGDADISARVSGIVAVMILPEYNNSDDDPEPWLEVGDHDLGATLEVGWDGPLPNDGASAERVGRLGLAILQASAQLAAIQAGVL